MQQLSPTDMREFQDYLEQNKQPGQLLVCGNAETLNACVQQLLASRATLYYFLCSGSEAFHVPCYLAGRSLSGGEELPSVETILNGVRVKQSSPQHMARGFEQVIISSQADVPSLLVIEFLTRPQAAEHNFIERLLAFAATRHELSVVICLHQDEGGQPVEPYPPAELDRERLLLLYLCGGRVRATDWQYLTDAPHDEKSELFSPSLSTRRVGTDVWFCYGRSQDAAWAASCFDALAPAERDRLLRKVLNSVCCPADYPTLALASEMRDLDLRLARRAFPTLASALIEPRVLAKYFYRLRRTAQRIGDAQLVSQTTLNYLAALLCSPETQAIRLYRVLCNAHADHEKSSLARLYGELGQRLVKARDPLILEAAAESFRRSRGYIDKMADLEDEERESAIAAIANGEALLAFKQGHPERACQIEQAGLARLRPGTPNCWLASQEMLLRTNLGDVYLRLLSNVGEAIVQYQMAYGLAITWSSVAMECYVAPKLAEALIRTGRREQAIEILEKFLARPDTALSVEEKITLKVRLTLAQAYWQSGSHRRAALWYWRLLQRPHHLAPATLRGISANLERCRPGMSPQLKAHMETLVVQQEEMLAAIKLMRVRLSREASTPQEQRRKEEKHAKI